MSPIMLLVFVAFLAGIYFYTRPANLDANNLESMTNQADAKKALEDRCPNILLQKDARFYLYNSKLAMVPGVNPIEFNNLEEYTEFLDWQRSQNIRCPVLYLQKTMDAQGEQVYRVRPSVTELQGGLPPSIPMPPNPTLLVDSTRNDKSYNSNSMPGYDTTDYYVGTTTPLDTMSSTPSGMIYSPDPMDPNWGGAEFTQNLVDKGFYAGNEVNLPAA